MKKLAIYPYCGKIHERIKFQLTQCVKIIIRIITIFYELYAMRTKNNKIYNKSILAVLLAVSSLVTCSCLSDMAFKRQEIERGTFGQELYTILAQNTVNSPKYGDEIHVRTFEHYREQFIDTVDHVAIEDELDALNQVFIDIVPLYENMLYPATLRKVAVLLDEWRQNPDAVDALAYLIESPRILKNPERANPVGRMFQYADLAAVTKQLLDMFLAHADTPYNATTQMLRAVTLTLETLQADPEPNRVLYRAFDLLTQPDEIYLPAISYMPQEAVRINARGWPEIQEVADSRVYPPFADDNMDGYADGNRYGFYTIGSGSRVSPYDTVQGTSAYFTLDTEGRLFRFENPVFAYFDLQKTPLAYLMREADALLRDNTLDDLLRAAHTLMGEGTEYTDAHGTYTGFSNTSGVAQLLSAVFATLDHDAVGPNFEAIITLLKDYPDEMARLVHDIDAILDITDDIETNVSMDNNLIDRLLPMLLEVVQTPGLLQDLMIALNDPLCKHIGPQMVELLQLRNTFITYDPNSTWAKCADTCHGTFDVGTQAHLDCMRSCPIQDLLGTARVDHTQPETLENRSLFQRVTHLMWETAFQPYGVHAEKLVVKGMDLTTVAQGMGNLIAFDNLAEAYLQTYTGHLDLTEHLSSNFIDLADLLDIEATSVVSLITWLTDTLFNLKLSIKPTTAEVTRLFNLPQIEAKNETYTFALNVALCKGGRTCLMSNADVLFAIEAVGLVDSLNPIIRVFNTHGKTHLVTRIVSTIFEYYESGDIELTLADGTPMPIEYDNIRSIEPVLERALSETPLLDDLGAVSDILVNLELKDGSRLRDRFADYVTYLLTPDAGLKNLMGETATKDPKGNRITPLSPAYLYIDAIRHISDITDAHPEVKTQLSNGLEGLMHVTLQTVKKDDTTIVFEKPAGIHLLATAVEFLHTLYVEESEKGTRSAWIHETVIPKIQDIIGNRIPYSYFQLFEELDRQENGLENFRNLILWLMESGSENPEIMTGAAYQLFAWILEQEHLIHLSHLMADIIDPDRPWTTQAFSHLSFVVTLLTCVHAFNQRDPEEAFNHVFARLFDTTTQARSNMGRLFEIAKAMFRPDPGSPQRCESACHKGILDFAYDLFTDPDRGVERIYEIIDFTIWGVDRRPKDWKPEDASWPIGD